MKQLFKAEIASIITYRTSSNNLKKKTLMHPKTRVPSPWLWLTYTKEPKMKRKAGNLVPDGLKRVDSYYSTLQSRCLMSSRCRISQLVRRRASLLATRTSLTAAIKLKRSSTTMWRQRAPTSTIQKPGRTSIKICGRKARKSMQWQTSLALWSNLISCHNQMLRRSG